MTIEMEELENEQSSGSGTSGSFGTNSGSASGSGTNGSAGNSDGSGGNSHGSAGNGNATAGIGDSNGIIGDTSAQSHTIDNGNNERTTNGDSDSVRESRNARERNRRSVRLGDSARDRNTVTDAGSDGRNADDETRIFGEPSVRLGNRKQGRPKSEVKTDAQSELKLSEMKDLISMFLDSVFEIPAVTLRQDFWRLQKEESKMLTEAVVAYIKSMPKARANWFTVFIQENLPLVNLVMVGFFIMSDRVRGSMQVAEHNKAMRAVTLGAENAPKKPANAGVTTPLDSMFSN